MKYITLMNDRSDVKTDKRARSTVRDVATLAGVSEISVSRVMRNAPNISDKLRDKVMEAANALSYTPNRVAGALKNQSSNLVAVVLPSMSNEVFSSVLDGIESVLNDQGLHAVLGLSEYDADRELRVIRELLSWSPMGIILTGLHHRDPIPGMIAQLDIPVVQIMDIEGAPIGSAVGISHSAAAVTAADHLYDKGYRKIGYIGAWSERPERSRARRLAFEARLEERGALLVASLIAEERSSAMVGARATETLRRQHPDIDCIFFANDDLALGGLFHALSAGIDVPGELGLLGFNGIEIGKATPIPLSSIETPRFEMGREAAKLLLSSKDDGNRVMDLSFKISDGKTV
ncbi:LacI family DNA-binding transcriptional regulator [uncultured Tateyamaria sp.]|uniref:LacI family DNA-binding transcriptional regulator n=1 Tax=uncultured Tateyamaria sp. TaxID=455651 RepID=UPI0026079C15|nr:LacI family DNA-binding transcriptional regulator [uncultured Tateyamaria sp.]